MQSYFPSASPLPSRPTGELDYSSLASPQISNPSTPGSSVSKSNRSCLFEIPEHWRPEVEECIRNQSLEESARCEIVRTLVSLLFSRFAKPTREQCGSLARQLILKHPFMKDDMGNGYVSGNYLIRLILVCSCGMSKTTLPFSLAISTLFLGSPRDVLHISCYDV